MNYAKELKTKSSHYILTGFSIVVALSWNDTVKTTVNKIFPLETDAIMMRVIYSLFITLILIIIIKYMPDTAQELPPIIKREVFKCREGY